MSGRGTSGGVVVFKATDEGIIYVQAKTSLLVSKISESEFYSVVDQFVRQYKDGGLR